MIEAGLRVIMMSAHMPFAEKRSLVTRLLQITGKINCTLLGWYVVIDHAMAMHILAGQNRRATRRTQCGSDKAIFEVNAFFRKLVHIGSV